MLWRRPDAWRREAAAKILHLWQSFEQGTTGVEHARGRKTLQVAYPERMKPAGVVHGRDGYSEG